MEQVETHADADDIADGIDRADFVEVNVFDTDAMSERFGFAEDLEDAMLQLSAWARAHVRETPPRILICGSLYLAGQVLAENG